MTMDAPSAWLDGRLVAVDAGAAAGPGVFTTLRLDDGRPELLEAHLARLARDARALALPWPPPWDPVRALEELSAVLPRAPRAVRVRWAPPHLALDARAVPTVESGWRALVDGPGRTPVPEPRGAKTLARAGYDALLGEARARGLDEGLVLGPAGELLEGTRTNLFVALDGELVTPPLASGPLPGVMRALVLTELEREPLVDARGRRWTVRAGALGRAELAAAEEILLTNAVRRVVGAVALRGELVRDGLPGAGGAACSALLARVIGRARPGGARPERSFRPPRD